MNKGLSKTSISYGLWTLDAILWKIKKMNFAEQIKGNNSSVLIDIQSRVNKQQTDYL